jgi:hypothetical protein
MIHIILSGVNYRGNYYETRNFVGASVCVINGFAGNGSQQAAVTLLSANAFISQTSDTSWTLKNRRHQRHQQTVTWSMTATLGLTVGGRLVVNGFMTVYNSAAKGATIDVYEMGSSLSSLAWQCSAWREPTVVIAAAKW